MINPSNAALSMVHLKENRFNKYRIWKPLGLLILARLTPPEWDITVVDENLHLPDYRSMPRPDLVGLTAFTSQADRAYKVAKEFRNRGVPVVMGGIHATMRLEETLDRVDAVVTGEAEEVWARVLEDARFIQVGLRTSIRFRRPDTICFRPATPSDPFRQPVVVPSIAATVASRPSTEAASADAP